MDFTQNEAQFPTADLARRQNKTVIAGPLNLVQGGVGIIARIPIYLEDKDRYPEGFWGLASAVIDMDIFYEECGLNSLPPEFRLAIRGKDASGSQGEVFWGDAEVFSLLPITADLALPYGSWQIAAVPGGGWSTSFFHVT